MSHGRVQENMAQVKSSTRLERVQPEARTSAALSRLYVTRQLQTNPNGHTLTAQANSLFVCICGDGGSQQAIHDHAHAVHKSYVDIKSLRQKDRALKQDSESLVPSVCMLSPDSSCPSGPY